MGDGGGCIGARGWRSGSGSADVARNDYPYLDDNGTRFVAGDDHVARRSNADATSYDVWAIGRDRVAPRAEVLALSNVFIREQGVTGFSTVRVYDARLKTTAGSRCAVHDRTLPGLRKRLRGRMSYRARILGARGDEPPHRSAPGSGPGMIRGERWRALLAAGAASYARPRARASLALWQQAERLRIDSDRRSPAAAKRLGMMGAASVQWEASDIWHLFALGALDCEGTGENGSVSTCGALEPSARLGVSVALGPEARLYANIGRYVRVPTLGELFGLSSALRGSPSLVPETGISADLGRALGSTLGSAVDSRLPRCVRVLALRLAAHRLPSIRAFAR